MDLKKGNINQNKWQHGFENFRNSYIINSCSTFNFTCETSTDSVICLDINIFLNKNYFKTKIYVKDTKKMQ